MPAEFLANDFGAIARALRRNAPSTPTVLHFWDLLALLTSEYDSVEAAVAEAYAIATSDTGIPVRITAPDGTMLMDTEALDDAMIRFGEGMPV